MKNFGILNEIRKELSSNVDEEYKKGSEKFFKEKINTYGVRTPFVRSIAKKYFRQVKHLEKEEIFYLCEDLFKSSYNEETTIAIQWIAGIEESWEAKDFEILKRLLGYIDNWGKCDDFCLKILSHFIIRFPEFKDEVKSWANSKNRWKRRVSAVSFIRGGSWLIYDDYLDDVFDVALALLEDEDDLVRKGYGWMLKVAADSFRDDVFDFVMENKDRMPRVSLRYAIEKMPKDMRKKAMSRELSK